MSAARQGSGRRAGRRRRRTAQQRPTPGRGLIPCRRSRIAFPRRTVVSNRLSPDIPGRRSPRRRSPSPGARENPLLPLFPSCFIFENGSHAMVSLRRRWEKRKEKQWFANWMVAGNLYIRRHFTVQVCLFSATDGRRSKPLFRAGYRVFASTKRVQYTIAGRTSQ